MVTSERVFNHGDFHPGNLVWAKHRLSGVVDWSGTRPGPRWSELAYFRVELAVLIDARLANAILRTYEQLTGHTSPMQAAWDLLHVLDGHTDMPFWLEAYRDQGRRDMTLDIGRTRLRRLAQSLLARL
jgi:aminoglycoside phosphotransferase (APT) family kinase protein